MMKSVMPLIAVLMIAGAVHGANAQTVAHPWHNRALTDTELRSVGCVGSGTAGTAAAALVGPAEIAMVLTGGAAALPAAGVAAVGALAFGSFCAIGYGAAPAVALAGEEIESTGWEGWVSGAWTSLGSLFASGHAAVTDLAGGVMDWFDDDIADDPTDTAAYAGLHDVVHQGTVER